METLSIIAAPAADLGDVARKLLRYLRMDDTRRVIDWRRLDGGAHRIAVCDLADTLLSRALPPGDGLPLSLARQYEAAVWDGLGIAARMDALSADLPPWGAEVAALEGLLVAASEKAKDHPGLRPMVDNVLEMVSREHDAVEEVAGIGDILGTIREINEVSTTIASAVEEQQAATAEIARNVEQAALGTDEVARNVAGVREAAAEAGRAASQVQAEAGTLSQTSEELSSQASGFIHRIREA